MPNTIVRVVWNDLVGLKLVPTNAIGEIVPTDIAQCMVEPSHGDLMQCSKDCLRHLVDPLRRYQLPYSTTKFHLASRAEENWGRITADHVDLMRWHQGAHRPNLRSVFDVALAGAQQALQNVGVDIEPNAEVLRAMEDAGIMEAVVEVNQEIAQAFDPDAYHGQPHQQPPLGGYNTPQSVSTQQVLEGEEPEAFVLDYSESDTEKQDKTVFKDPNMIEPLLSLQNRRIEFEWVEKKFEYPIIVRVPLKEKDIDFMVIIATSTSLADLLNELGNMTGNEIPKDKVAGYVVGNSSRVMMYETISSYCDRNGTLVLRPPMSGGVLQRWKSKPMKKDDALMALVARSKERIVSKIDTTLVQETSVPVPVIFASSINQIDGKIATYRQRMVAGELKMEAVLASLPDEKIDFLLKIFAFKTNESTEQKIMDAVEVIYEDITTLEEAIVHLKKAKMNIVSFFLEFYSKEFHRERGTVIQYDNASFLKMLTDTQNYRKGVRAMVDAGSEVPNLEVSTESGCVIF